MPRLVDADALRELIDGGYDVDFDELPETKRALLEMIDHQDTVDAVEVVRCQYCIWWDIQHPYGTLVPDAYHCKVNNRFYSAEHFCAYGERKE